MYDAVRNGGHIAPFGHKPRFPQWAAQARRFALHGSLAHHWVEKACYLTDAMATQIIPKRELGDTSQVSADQSVTGTWSGTDTQETMYIDGQQWDIGCRGSVKYDSIISQMDDCSYSRGVPRHEVTIAMLTDAHWQEVFNMFVNSTVAVHGMSVTECIAHLRAVTFQETGHEHETATEFLQRYAARVMAMGDVS